MKKQIILFAWLLFAIVPAVNLGAQNNGGQGQVNVQQQPNLVTVQEYYVAGPYELKMPFMAADKNVQGRPFDPRDLMKTSVPVTDVASRGTVVGSENGTAKLPLFNSEYGLYVLSFYLNADRFCSGNLRVNGQAIAPVEVYLDGKPQRLTPGGFIMALEPRRYEVSVKYVAKKADSLSFRAAFEYRGDAVVETTLNPEKRYTLQTMMTGKRFGGVSLSPDGKMMMVIYRTTMEDGKSSMTGSVVEVSSGKTLMNLLYSPVRPSWMPKSNLFWYVRTTPDNSRDLVTVDPRTGKENVIAKNVPNGNFRIAPTEDYLIYTMQENGPEEKKEIREILVPDDRQPGWRNRSFLYKFDMKSGVLARLTFGNRTTNLYDISNDGRKLLFGVSEQVLTDLPHSRSTVMIMDLATEKVDTLWKAEKYVGGASFSPDGKQLLVTGAGPAFDEVGLNINEGQLTNTYDNQLFIYNIADGKVSPLTKDFKPSIERASWNKTDKKVYALATDRDYVRIYAIDPAKGTAEVVTAQEDVAQSYAMATNAPVMAYFGVGMTNTQRLYTVNLRSRKATMVEDLSAEALKNVNLGQAQDWNFTSSYGDVIEGRFYLPPHFDPNKKYPLVVYYYGGTTPVNRALESRYAAQLYTAQDYIYYVLQPSGTIGYGQEFSARHVNAWGKQTADEIIEGTKRFCAEHPYVDAGKIGCMGASYGGFMTQYLQTVTDIFAAAVSHAGISNIASYWGEGYWGYSYSSVASMGSYPWNNPDLYVKQSPLFNADKINTPILFLHGSADTNVPVGESIQMFTALKLLGKETAFVEVPGEDHGIMDWTKRNLWQNTIYAWFARWLKDQPEWWNAMYTPKEL